MPITIKSKAIKQKRVDARLTLKQAAGLLYIDEAQYQRYESGTEKMPYGLYELLCIKTGLLRNQRIIDALRDRPFLLQEQAA